MHPGIHTEFIYHMRLPLPPADPVQYEPVECPWYTLAAQIVVDMLVWVVVIMLR
jgi:hypothetical protein